MVKKNLVDLLIKKPPNLLRDQLKKPKDQIIGRNKLFGQCLGEQIKKRVKIKIV